MITLTIDGRTVSVPKGTLLVEAARQAGIEIPVYCYHPKLEPAGACRMCMVEIEKMRKLQTACTTTAGEGMVVHTRSEAVQEARRGVLELLLINHPLDCPICDKGGECDLQDFTLKYGPPLSRFEEHKINRRKHVEVPPFLVLDEERCILCQRCVRYEDEILGERNLVLIERGRHTTIGPEGRPDYPGYFAGNNTELCPVGALTSRAYRFRARPWDLERRPTICTQCSLHCNVRADARHGDLMRLMIRENPAVDGGWLCDRGRYGIGDVRSAERIEHPMVRRDGELVPVSWEAAIREANRALAASQVAGLGGGRLSNEAAAAFKTVCKTVDWRVGRQRTAVVEGVPQATPADLDTADVIVLVDTCPTEEAPVLDLRIRRAARDRKHRIIDLGPVPNVRVGQAERVTCGPDEVAAAVRALDLASAAHPVVIWNGCGEGVGEAISALGAPCLMVHEFANARGAHEAGCETGGDIIAGAAAGQVHTLFLAGANPIRTCPDGALARQALERVPLLIVSDLYMTESAELADIVLPVAGPFERAGTYTNLAGLTQTAARVVQPRAEARSDVEIFAQLTAAARPATDLPPRGGRSPEVKKGALRLLLRPLLYVGGGSTAGDPVLAPARPAQAPVRVHPSAGLPEGAPVRINGTMDAVVELDDRIQPGIAVLPDRWAGANALGATVDLAVQEARVG